MFKVDNQSLLPNTIHISEKQLHNMTPESYEPLKMTARK